MSRSRGQRRGLTPIASPRAGPSLTSDLGSCVLCRPWALEPRWDPRLRKVDANIRPRTPDLLLVWDLNLPRPQATNHPEPLLPPQWQMPWPQFSATTAHSYFITLSPDPGTPENAIP